MQVQSIARKKVARGPMEQLSEVRVTQEAGLEEDVRGRGGIFGFRQVTVLSLDQWQVACGNIGVELPWHTRRANLGISGYSFGPGDKGKKLHFPSGVVLQITGETKPCRRMDEEHDGLREALTPDWRGGVTCRVLYAGTISVGESVSIS